MLPYIPMRHNKNHIITSQPIWVAKTTPVPAVSYSQVPGLLPYPVFSASLIPKDVTARDTGGRRDAVSIRFAF